MPYDEIKNKYFNILQEDAFYNILGYICINFHSSEFIKEYQQIDNQYLESLTEIRNNYIDFVLQKNLPPYIKVLYRCSFLNDFNKFCPDILGFSGYLKAIEKHPPVLIPEDELETFKK
jgi:hypothetical protein